MFFEIVEGLTCLGCLAFVHAWCIVPITQTLTLYKDQAIHDGSYDASLSPEFSCPTTPSSWPPQVYRFKWHMGHYGAPTPKPQQGWTNSRHFAKIRKGKWSYSDQEPSSVKTVKKSISKTSGKASYSGTPELKASQSGTYMLFIPQCDV